MTGNLKFDKIILIINLVFVLASVGLVGYSHLGIKKEITDQVDEFEKLKKSALEATQITPVKIKKIVVNIVSSPDRLRFLEVEMDVLPFDQKSKVRINESEHIFKNTIISVADQMTHDELSSMTGKILLESRLKKKINESLGEPVVKQIFFSSYIVQ